MGYELKMFVGEIFPTPSSGKIVLVNKKIYSACPELLENGEARFIYYPDGNTKEYLKGEPMLDEKYFSVIGMIDLCKTDLITTGICSFEESDGTYMYAVDDGNKIVGLDSYDKYRSFVPIDTIIDELEKLTKVENPYRRYEIALALLKEVKRTFVGSKVGCVFYGH